MLSRALAQGLAGHHLMRIDRARCLPRSRPLAATFDENAPAAEQCPVSEIVRQASSEAASTRLSDPFEAGGDIHPISRPNLLSPEEGRRSKPEFGLDLFVHLCRDRLALSSDVEDKFLELGRTFCSVRPFSRADDVDSYRRCAGQDFPCFRPPTVNGPESLSQKVGCR